MTGLVGISQKKNSKPDARPVGGFGLLPAGLGMSTKKNSHCKIQLVQVDNVIRLLTPLGAAFARIDFRECSNQNFLR